MSGDVTLPSTTRLVVDTDNRLLLGGHRLEVGGDLYVRVSDYSADGIRLLDPNDVLVVEGDATFTSRGYNHSATSEGNFIAGTAYFRGDFSQTRESSGAEKSFVSTGTKVVFDGSAAQTVYFSHPSTGGSRFAELELRNTAGISTNTLVADDPVLVSTGASVTTTGSVTFGDTFTVDGGTMVVTATPTITGKVTVPDPSVEVKNLPNRRVASLVHKGSYETIGPAYAKLYDYVVGSGLELSGPMMDVYLNDPNTVEPDEILTEIQAPVKQS